MAKIERCELCRDPIADDDEIVIDGVDGLIMCAKCGDAALADGSETVAEQSS